MRKKIIKIKLVDGFPINDEYYEFLLEKLEEKYEIIFSDEPDYLFCGCYANEFFKYDCIKILFLGENISPDFNLYDYAVGFDYLNFADRYLRYPIYVYWKKDFELAAHKHERLDEYFLNKKKFCNFVYSNSSWNEKIREEFFKKLSAYKCVDAGGKVFNNIGYRVGDKRAFQEEYKFAIVFENSSKLGYTTEKIINAYAAGNIPIYWGNRNIEEEFNPKSFINVFDFDSLEECIEYIEKVDNDDDLYLQIQREPIFNGKGAEIYYKQKDMLVDFLSHIFEQQYADAKRVADLSYGYNSEYKKIIRYGWGVMMAYKKPYRIMRDTIKLIIRK